MEKIFVGVDVHQSSWAVTLLTGKEIVFRGSISPCVEDILKIFKKHGVTPANSCIGYEIGPQGFVLYDKLTPLGYGVVPAAPHHIPREPNRKIKTDPRDSLELAQLLQGGLLRPISVPTLQERAVRDLVRTRQYLVQDRAAMIQLVKSKLAYLGIDYNHRPWSKAFEEWAFLQPMPEEYRASIQLVFSTMASVATQIRAAEKEIHRLIENFSGPISALYRTVPGIGPVAAAILITELRDLSRFASPDKLVSYLGLCPGEHSSGDTVHRGPITRQGNTRARTILVEASWILIRKDTAMRKFYGKIAARRGSKKAIVAVARKLAHALWAMNRSGGCYHLSKAA